MPTFTTEAIVIKHSNFGEADRIITVLTPYRGKLNLIAKGVRRITSRRAGNIEPLNRVKIHIFQGSGLPILTEAESLEVFPKLKSDLTLSTYGSYALELINRLVPQEQPNKQIYQLLVDTLRALAKNPRQIFIRAFEIKLLNFSGFWSVGQVQVDDEIKEILIKLQNQNWDEIEKYSINKLQAEELEKILVRYTERILESPLKSLQVMKKVKSIGNKAPF